MHKLPTVVLVLTLIAGCAGSEVYEERVTYDHGIAHECGEGPGLSPCRDVSGETYAHELDPNYVGLDSNEELTESAEKIRSESPEELEKTIEGLEHHD
jgi:hypothetical protein